MKFAKAAQVISALPSTQSVLLLGPPGIGKTALGKAVCRQMATDLGMAVIDGEDADKALDVRDAKVKALVGQKNPKNENKPYTESEAQALVPPVVVVEVRDLCSHLPEDLLGLPFPKDGVTHYNPPTWLARLSRKGVAGVLILDDLAAASPAVQTACFQMLLERKSGDCRLQPTVKIIATANRREDKSGATMLPAALRNRCYIETIEVDPEAWCIWAAQEKLHPDVPAFMRWKSAHLSHVPKDADERGQFATPRTWEMLARALPAAKATDSVVDVAAGLVGNGVAIEFKAFVDLRDALPNPREVLENPEKAMPHPPSGTDPSRIIAIVTAIAECAAPLSMEKKTAAETPYQFMHALCHVSQGAREYAGAGILTYAANGGNVATLIKCARDGRADPRFKDLLKHLKQGLLPQGAVS